MGTLISSLVISVWSQVGWLGGGCAASDLV